MDWKKTLKGSPVETLKSTCLTMLTASNETLFHAMVKEKDIEGGFIARTFIVRESERRGINSLVEKPAGTFEREALLSGLKRIAKIKGEFKWTKRAGEEYTEWYTKLCKMRIDDRTGSVERLGDQVLKVAMLLSLARKDDLNLDREDIMMAILRAESCMPAVNVVGLSSQTSEVSSSIMRILKLLLASPEQTMARNRILTKLHPYGVDAVVLDRCIESMKQSGALEKEYRSADRKQILYTLSRKAYNLYTQFESEEA